VLLLAHRISFAHPSRELIIKFRPVVQTERVQMISRRESLDAGETRMLDEARKNKVPDEVVSPHLNRDERHAHLKGNARFLRQYLNRPAVRDHLRQRIKQFAHVLALANEM